MSSRHALVTGAGSGIGKAIALALAADGHAVSLAGRRAGPLDAVRDEIRASGGEAFVHHGFDVTDAGSVERGIAAAISQAGDIAVLVNCAGEAPSAPFEKTDLALWQRVLSINLTGVFLVTQAALASVRRAGNGRIVNVASTAGLTGYAYVSAYCASKHGIIGLTRALALELARSDVTVNAVCPGFTDTPLIDGALDTISEKTGRSREDARATLARANPQGRLVTPGEVAHTVSWLVSEKATAITGQAIAVAGGEIL
jgi:ketoreductase